MVSTAEIAVNLGILKVSLVSAFIEFVVVFFAFVAFETMIQKAMEPPFRLSKRAGSVPLKT